MQRALRPIFDNGHDTSGGGLPVHAALENEALERELRARGVSILRSGVRARASPHTGGPTSRTGGRTSNTGGRTPGGLARHPARSDWGVRRSYTAEEFTVEELLELKQSTIALILPAREVATTIGPIVDQATRLLDVGLLDKALVIDAASQDGTAEVAEAAGIAVVQQDRLSRELGPTRGKGDAMWRALRVLGSDIVVFADTDTVEFGERFLTGLLGPLLRDPQVQLVKGFRRSLRAEGTPAAHGRERVTELMARPLLNLHAPELAVFDQPLAGETAARRELLETLPFSAGDGVEIAMLIDAWRKVGLDGLAQVNLGAGQDRNQSHRDLSMRELSAMSYAVLVAAQRRFIGSNFAAAHACGSISLPVHEGDGMMESRAVTLEERPPLASIRERQ